MATLRSRYQNTKPFVFDDGEAVRYRGMRPREISTAAGVIEHALCSWDRLDHLAQHYYGDPRKWWRILDANPDIVCGCDLEVEASAGTIILIPRVADKENIR